MNNLHALPGGRSFRPSRNGQPWTEEDYEALVTTCREGVDLETLAERLGRTELAVLDRARKMLPVDERGLPRDRAVTRLRELLRSEEGYDWSAAMRQAPPPPPVEHRVYRREGIAGLRAPELLAVAEALVLQPLCDRQVREDVLRRVEQRGLVGELEQQVGARLVRRAQPADAPYLAEAWDGARRTPGWSTGREWERPWCDEDCPTVEPDVLPDVAPERDDPSWW